MRVRIVCYEDKNAWILGKFARRMSEELCALSVDSDIAKVPDSNADINHHIIYCDYNGNKNGIDTVMVTHIDSVIKVKQLEKQLEVAEMAICMSAETMRQMISSGLPREKLCYINPAHDCVMKPRKTVIGITSKTHDDGRKKENLLLELSKRIRPDEFMFKIMGSGWQGIVDEMCANGFTVEYFSEFDYKLYVQLMPSLDYFFYFSFDEGSMGYIDALAAGVQTIVTPQGFHLDALGGITYPVRNLEEIVKAFEEIAGKKRALASAVSTWTWANYARKHLEIWEYLINNRNPRYYSEHTGNYPDGLASLATNGGTSFNVIIKAKVIRAKDWFSYYFQSRERFKDFLRLFIPKQMRDVYSRCKQWLLDIKR